MPSATGVSLPLSAAHRDLDTGQMHGHTWLVTAWWPREPGQRPRDVRHLRAMLQDELAALDHTVLPDHVAWAEDLAEYLLGVLGCSTVEVSRPLEGLYAKAWR